MTAHPDLVLHRDLIVTEAGRHARRLAHRLGLAGDHADDLRQELLLDLLERRARFDPERSPFTAFARMVMRHHAATLADRLVRELRRPLKPLVEDLADLDEDTDDRPTDGVVDPMLATAVERLDLARTLDRLPEVLRAICAALEDHPTTDAAGTYPASRATFYRRLAELRLELLTWDLQPAA